MLFRRKNHAIIIVAAAAMTLSFNYTTAFANTFFYKSSEGIGIEVSGLLQEKQLYPLGWIRLLQTTKFGRLQNRIFMSEILLSYMVKEPYK